MILNKKILFYIVLSTIFSGVLKAQVIEQTLTVHYDFAFAKNATKSSKIELSANKNNSLNKIVDTYRMQKGGERYDQKITKFIFKDYKKKTMCYEEPLIGKQVILQENLNKVKWKLIDSFEQILGYKCQKAIAKYRGREYIAYFTTDIPFKAAPWKFHGLPGVTLKVTSIDNDVKIVATNVKIHSSSIKIKNMFEDNEKLSWDQFIHVYKKNQKKFQESLTSKASSNSSALSLLKKLKSSPRIEIIPE